MIEVTMQVVKNKVRALKVVGHAQASEEEHSLVCAAVSSILTGGFNSLDTEHFDLTIYKGYARLHVNKRLPQRLQGSLYTIIVSLETVAEAYPQMVKITRSFL